jgi:branched-chain amino acid transport system substrate-binding protein
MVGSGQRRRLVLSGAAALVIAAVAAGCGGGGGASTPSSSSKSTKGPVVIGESLGETGFLSAFDVPASQGAQIAADEINASGGIEGRKIVLKKVNNQSEATQAYSAAKTLIDEGSQILLGSCNAEQGGPTARAANEAHLVMFSFCGGEPKLSRQVGNSNVYTFDMGNETNGVGASMAAFAYKKGLRNVYLLEDTEINYSQEMCNFFTRAWKEYYKGTSVIGKESFKNADTSIGSQVTAIKSLSKKPDAIVLCSFLPGGATALRQLRAAGIDTPVVTGDGMDGPALFSAVPNLSNFYEVAAASVYGDDPEAGVQTLVKKFEQTTGKKPEGSYLVFGYSIIQAIDAAMKKDGGSTEGPKLRESLESFRREPLLIGPMTFTKTEHVDGYRPQKIIQVQKDKPAYVETITPKQVPNPFGGGSLTNPNA